MEPIPVRATAKDFVDLFGRARKHCPQPNHLHYYHRPYRQRATYGSLVQIGLKKDSNGSNDYSVATFRLLRDFQGEELAQIRAYANVFKGQIKTINIQRALINEEQRANDCDYEIPESATAAPGPDGSYVVGEINGDYEQLPA